jgi:predicted RNA binding protein YcfA (HicA-like mRNA interferase family)
MSKHGKLLRQVPCGTSDANIAFDDLCQLLIRVGFQERITGSHHVFRKEDVRERINLQREGDKAKAYQVRQVREVFAAHELGEGL